MLRQDNADRRLVEYSRAAGLIDDARYAAVLEKCRREDAEIERLERTTVSPSAANGILASLGSSEISTGARLADLLRRPQITYEALAGADPNRPDLPEDVIRTVETEIKYAGYITRQQAQAKKQKKLEEKALPQDLDYTKIKGLRLEAMQKLQAAKPASLGQASRISGVSPADISVLVIYLSLKD